MAGIYVRTEEMRKKISESTKGINNHNYGKHFSEETKRKMSEAHEGKITWNKGIPRTEKAKKKMSEAHKGLLASEETKKKISKTHKGDRHPNWKGGITPLNKSIRNCFKNRQWISDIFTRDNFTCQECGQRGCYLNAHHIKSFSKILQYYEITNLEEALNCAELWNINNGITLCKECHRKLCLKGVEVNGGNIG